MNTVISPYLIRMKPYLKQLIEELSKHFSYVSLLGVDTRGKDFRVEKSGARVEDSAWNERGFVIRVHNGVNYCEYSFNELEENQILSQAEKIKNIFLSQLSALKESSIPVNSYQLIEEEELSKSFYAEISEKAQGIGIEEKLNRLQAIKDKALKQYEALVDFRTGYSEVHISKLFLSPKKDLAQSYIWSEGHLVPIVRKDDITKYCHRGFSGLKSVELLDEMEAAIDKVVEEAMSLLTASTIEPGEYEVICTPDVAGLIAHEAFGHGVEMDMFVKERALAVNYIDKRVASDLVVMHDGAASAKDVSSYLFDDEGTLAKDTVIIQNGILKRGISDLLSALMLGTEPTGNGKRQSFERKAYTRMTNTFFATGEHSLEEMIASVKFGYLLDIAMSGMEDPKNWGIQCMLMKGLEIKDGKLTGNIVSPVIMTGYVPDLLKSISMISGDFSLSGTGACGKGYKELVKVSAGGPYIKAKARLG